MVTSGGRSVDVYAAEECGISVTDWAEITGRDHLTVPRNRRRAQRGTEQ